MAKIEISSDVAVIGSGCAGMAVAYTAAESGASVVIIEKSDRLGGVCSGGNGVFAVDTDDQHSAQSNLTVKQIYDRFMDYSHYKADPKLVSKFISKTADTYSWLKSFGIEFSGIVGYFRGADLVWHQRSDDSPMITPTIYKACQDKGFNVKCYLATKAEKILKDDSGAVSGVQAIMPNGDELIVTCKAAAICTGGFGANDEMVTKYLGLRRNRDYYPFSFPEVQGEGIRMAWDAGAGRSDMFYDTFVSMTGVYAAGPGGVQANLGIFRQPLFLVNSDGQRFVNEEIMKNPSYAGNAVHQQRNGCAFMIFDDTICDYYENHDWEYQMSGLGFKRSKDTEKIIRSMIDGTYIQEGPGFPGSPDFSTWPGVIMGNGAKPTPPMEPGDPQKPPFDEVYIADSLEDLARQTGIDYDGLRDQLQRYNTFCETGRDTEFFKDAQYLRPLTGKKFYACKFALAGYGTLGGIKIDSDARVLTDDCAVIPGLYAAGNDANSIYGGTYPFTFSGNTSSFCYNVGRIAGEHIAKYVGK